MSNIAETMRRATTAYGRGDLPLALREAESAHRAQARNPAILQFIGVVLSQSGNPAAGLVRFRQALALTPGNADLRFNAAKAAFDLGDLRLARQLCTPLAATREGGTTCAT